MRKAVGLPGYQRQHMGTALIHEDQKRYLESGIHRIVVLGHRGYYRHFGFAPLSGFGIASEYHLPDEMFLVMELVPGAFRGVSGVAKYHPEFDGL